METVVAFIIAFHISVWDFGGLYEMMKKIDRYDSLIQYYVETTIIMHEPIDWLLIKSMINQESGFDPKARSNVGAAGLLQLMPETAEECGVADVYNPEENINGGVRYLKHLWTKFSEIKDEEERLKFTIAAYNAGRGNINKALSRARESEGLPYTYKEWVNQGCPDGQWSTWEYSSQFLHKVTGKSNANQTINYVDRILSYYNKLNASPC